MTTTGSRPFRVGDAVRFQSTGTIYRVIDVDGQWVQLERPTPQRTRTSAHQNRLVHVEPCEMAGGAA